MWIQTKNNKRIRSWGTNHGQFGLTRLTTARTWGKPSPSPLVVYSAPFHEGHIQMAFCFGTPKWELGLPRFWGPIISRANLRLQWDLKQSCSPHWEFSKGMLHVACMRKNRVDYQLLMVGSQIVILTLDLSFDHNLCFRCPNGRCEPILNIYVSIAFEWYKKLFQPMGCDPWNCALKIWKSIWDSNFHNGSSLESVRVHSFTLFTLPGTCDVIPTSPSWPATLQPLALIVSPRLGLRH
jgi:hypothetical protein